MKTRHQHAWVGGRYPYSKATWRVCKVFRAVERHTSSGWIKGAQAANPTQQKNIARSILGN